MYNKRLNYKDKVNFKIHDVTAWLANICKIHIAQYLKKKGNQAIQYGHLIQYNMRSIFVEESYTKCAGDTAPRLLSKKLKLSISLDHERKVLNSFFLLEANWRAFEI